MALPTTLKGWNDLVVSAGYTIDVEKNIGSHQLAGLSYSPWTLTGYPAGAGAAAANGGTSYTNASNGAWNQHLPAPAAGLSWYLHSVDVAGYSPGSLMLVDRYCGGGGLSGTATTTQTLTTPALPSRAPTNGVGVMMGVEVTSSNLGVNSVTLTVNYTNDQGLASSVTTAAFVWGGTNNGNRFYQLPLAAGDKGVQSVQSVLWSGTTGTNGTFAIILYGRVCTLSVSAGAGVSGTNRVKHDLFATGLPLIDPNCCLMPIFTAAADWGNNDFRAALTFVQAG